jgi:hypothetical protein
MMLYMVVSLGSHHYLPPFFFFFCALTILEDGVALNDARKLDDEVLAVVFNNIGGRRHGDDAVRVHHMSFLFSFFLCSYT